MIMLAYLGANVGKLLETSQLQIPIKESIESRVATAEVSMLTPISSSTSN